MAIAPITKEYGITIWNYGGATDEITERGYTNFINAITPSSNYYHGIIDLFEKKLPNKNKQIALVFAKDSGFSTKVKDGAKNHALDKNFDVYELAYSSGKSDFTDIVNKIYELQSDLVLGVGRTEDDINFAKSIISSGKIAPCNVGLIAASINHFRETLGKDSEGFLSTSQWEKDVDIKPDFGPNPSEFYNDFMNSYHKEPNYLAAQAYNIGLLIERCIEIAGNIEAQSLYETARDLDTNTFYGRFKIDKKTGIQTGHKMLVTQWKNGKKIIMPKIK